MNWDKSCIGNTSISSTQNSRCQPCCMINTLNVLLWAVWSREVGLHTWPKAKCEWALVWKCESQRLCTLCVVTAGRPRLLCVNRTQSLLIHLHTHTRTHTHTYAHTHIQPSGSFSLPRLLWSKGKGVKAQRWKVIFTGTALPLPPFPN